MVAGLSQKELGVTDAVLVHLVQQLLFQFGRYKDIFELHDVWIMLFYNSLVADVLQPVRVIGVFVGVQTFKELIQRVGYQ